MDRVCHFEVPYADKARVEDFYQKVFGWQFQDAPGDMPYTFAIREGSMQEQGGRLAFWGAGLV